MFSESDLRCLDDDELLIVLSNKQPILTRQNTYYINEEYTQNIKPPIDIKRKSINKINVRDKILDLQVNSEIQQEDDYDIKKDLFR